MSGVGGMLVNIGPIKLKRGVPLPIDVPDRWPEPGELGEGVEARAPVHVEGTVTNTGKAYYVDARLTTEVGLSCSRCLRSFRYEVNLPFVEEFHRRPKASVEAADAESSPLPWEEDDTAFTGDHIDLWEPVRETIALNLPLKALCHEACPGLCPVCGQDLNMGACACPRSEGDPRLAVLRELLTGLDGVADGPGGDQAAAGEEPLPRPSVPLVDRSRPGRNGKARR